MKLAMIGVRGHYGYVLDGLVDLPQVRVVGLCAGTPEDSMEPIQAWCRQRGHAPAVFPDRRQMFDTAKPDVAVVCGPFEDHAVSCMEALERGIHVLCEKPVAMSFEELARLRRARSASQAHFAAMMSFRYEPAFYTAWTLVKAGAVGTVCLVTARKSYKMGERPAYYRARATYGGTLLWVGSHAIDWIYWLSGQSFQSVSAAHTAQWNRQNGTMETAAVCQFVMTRQVLATAHLDYLRPPNAPTHGDDGVRVAGTMGVIEVLGGQVRLINAQASGDEAVAVVPGPRNLFVDFVGQVEGTVPALIGADDTLAVAEACLLARQSADENRRVEFP